MKHLVIGMSISNPQWEAFNISKGRNMSEKELETSILKGGVTQITEGGTRLHILKIVSHSE